MRKDIIQSKTEPNKNNIWLSEEGLKKYGKNGWEPLGGGVSYAPIADTISGNELIPIKQDGENKAVSVEQIKNKVINNGIIEFPSKYEFVDLGLPSGIKWATTNIGAVNPEDAGLYFAWGETQGYTAEDVAAGKKVFSWDDYKFGTQNNLTKYNATDSLTQLELTDDAAYQSDNTCKMPTKDEIQELVDNTTSTWETLNGVNGRRFTSKTNGNSIFVPAAGSCYLGSVNDVGSSGGLYSSSLIKNFSGIAWSFGFLSDDVHVGGYDRFYGLTIRPIQPANTPTTINLKELQDKVNNIETTGYGTKFLADDGSYKEVSGGDNTFVATLSSKYADIKSAIDAKKQILFDDENGGIFTCNYSFLDSKIYLYYKGNYNYEGLPVTTFIEYESNGTIVGPYVANKPTMRRTISTNNANNYLIPSVYYIDSITVNTRYDLIASSAIFEQIGKAACFEGQLIFGSTVYNISFSIRDSINSSSSGIKWSTDSVLEYKANHTYQFRIVNGLGVMKEFANA